MAPKKEKPFDPKNIKSLDELREAVGDEGLIALTHKLREEYLGRLDDMQAEFDAKKDPTAEDCVKLADALTEASLICKNKQQEMMRECEDLITVAKEKDPTNVKLAFLISRRARDSGKPQRAIVALERLIEAHGDTLDLSDRLLVQLELAINKREVGLAPQAKLHLEELRRILPKGFPETSRIQIDVEECLNSATQGGPWEGLLPDILEKCAKYSKVFDAQEKKKLGEDPRSLVDAMLHKLIELDVPMDGAFAKVRAHEAFKPIADGAQVKKTARVEAIVTKQAKEQKNRSILALVLFSLFFAFVFFKFLSVDKPKRGRSEF